MVIMISLIKYKIITFNLLYLIRVIIHLLLIVAWIPDPSLLKPLDVFIKHSIVLTTLCFLHGFECFKAFFYIKIFFIQSFKYFGHVKFKLFPTPYKDKIYIKFE